MLAEFRELNLYAYHTARGWLYDVIIWCLGPYVDDSREYALPRLYLAVWTRRLIRWRLRRVGML